jgi:hypothetical protein
MRRIIQYVMSSTTHGVSVWTEVLWLRGTGGCVAFAMCGGGNSCCEESSIGFLKQFFTKKYSNTGLVRLWCGF